MGKISELDMAIRDLRNAAATISDVADTLAEAFSTESSDNCLLYTSYSINIDIIHSVISGNESAFLRVLLAWAGFKVNTDPECEKTLIYLLTALSESAVFKLSDGSKDVIFNQNSIYRKLLETADSVDVNGDKEAKGPLRILKSLLSEGMNPYLQYSNGTVTVASPNREKIEDYQKRVDTLLRLYATKVIEMCIRDRRRR